MSRHADLSDVSIADDYRIFLEVLERGSMSKASWSLGLDVSIISRTIASLERRFSAILFERHARGVRLTKAGGLVADFIKKAVKDEIEIQRNLRGLQQLRGESLRVACTTSAISGPMSDVLNAFAAKYDDVQVEVHRVSGRAIVSAVVDGAADIGIGFNLDPASGVDVIKISDDVIAAVVPAEHPLARLKSVSPKELADYPIGAFESSCPNGLIVQRFLEDGPDRVRPTLVTNSLDTLKHFNQQHPRVSIFCSGSASHEISQGKLQAVPLAGVAPVRQEICVRRASEDNRVIKAFLQEVGNEPHFSRAIRGRLETAH